MTEELERYLKGEPMEGAITREMLGISTADTING